MVNNFGLPTQRDFQRATNIFNRAIREPVPPKKKKEILKRAKNKCERCKRVHNSDVKLHFHHKNMKNYDNKPSNIVAVCPNCHAKYHKEYKRVEEKDMAGITRSIRAVKRKPTKAKAKTKKKPAKKPAKKKRRRSAHPLDIGFNLDRW